MQQPSPPPPPPPLTRRRQVETLRPAVAAQWPAPAGETVEARSWEELCMLLSAGPGRAGLVYSGVADEAAGLAGSALRAIPSLQPQRGG